MKKEKTESSSSSNDDEFLNGFESNLDFNIYQREEEEVFDEQILNLNNDNREPRFEINNQELDNSNNILQNLLHNHTYTCNLNEEPTNNSLVKKSTTQQQQLNSINNRSQQTRTTSISQNESLETIRNRRLEQDRTNSRQDSINFDLYSITSETCSEEDRSLSRDEKKAKELNIPFTVCQIINMPIDEFNECLSKHEFDERQLTLIRDIRRRGKNKVAAQNCRKRKINQIIGLQSEVEKLQSQKNNLFLDLEKSFAIKELGQSKYQKLYDFIADRLSLNAALLNNFELNFRLTNNSEEYGAVGGLIETQFIDENQPNQLNQLNEITSTSDFLTKMDIKQENKVQSNYKKALAMN
jgi:hypothetical protein